MATDLAALADSLIAAAREHSRGRAAETVIGSDRMRATAMALRAGEMLGEHDAPPAATLQVLRGSVVLHADGARMELGEGEIGAIPQARHDLEAVTDAVVLLTVCLG